MNNKKTLIVLAFLFAVALSWGAPIDDLNTLVTGGYAVQAAEASGLKVETIDLNIQDFAGKQLRFSCEARGKDITKPSEGYGGVKFMVNYKCKDGAQAWPAGCDGKYGTFDWTPVSFCFYVPKNVDVATLNLGLQVCTGEVEFRNIKAEEIDIYPLVWNIPEGYKCEYDERVTGDIMRRGAMSPFTRTMTEQDIRDLASWGANLLRWQFMPTDAATMLDLEKYRAFLEDEITLLDRFLPLCDELGIKVIIDMHKVPGDRYGTNLILGTAGEDAVADQEAKKAAFRMFYEKEYLNAFLESWRILATHFKGNPAVWGYNLCNEPVQSLPVETDYLKCQYLAAKAIREIDPDTPIIVESNNWSSLDTFDYLQPLPFKNVIYQAHIYNPGSYTHQGVFEGMAVDLPYPGTHYGEWYDKEKIKTLMQPARDFELRYGAKIFIGEFGVIRWAPNAAQYLDDVASLLEDYKWPWCYHAFREWDGWSVEHVGPRNQTKKATEDTDRKKVLLKHFSRQ